MRFEKPNTTNRWDSPLFKVKIRIDDGLMNHKYSSSFLGLDEKQLPLEDVYLWLFEV